MYVLSQWVAVVYSTLQILIFSLLFLFFFFLIVLNLFIKLWWILVNTRFSKHYMAMTLFFLEKRKLQKKFFRKEWTKPGGKIEIKIFISCYSFILYSFCFYLFYCDIFAFFMCSKKKKHFHRFMVSSSVIGMYAWARIWVWDSH